MMKKYILATLPILIGVLCLFTKGIIGDEILPDGTLIERNFFLIPLSYLFFFSGIISLLFVAFISTDKKTNIVK
ncbi:group-specific protein [Lysinibacillus sphaericus]|uniref:DUF3955 domain-containing protein n=1 Tax=Lysinibacillus sphaericus TaxID=1421 RepID=UPI0018CE0CC6|nr:DUF3955 domain-containing protein [Lysinibacillus sphaericus]MBG9456215.1 group-specific protein [Lysinibacillus sphaericus]MBG9479211.1 group-specific protein [Lysinibacillus sphaericus]MBG9591491.1 group-specific protein [Lysinibacillus sphaericus]